MCTNTIGSFYCNCSAGYLLDGNGLNCSGECNIVGKSYLWLLTFINDLTLFLMNKTSMYL